MYRPINKAAAMGVTYGLGSGLPTLDAPAAFSPFSRPSPKPKVGAAAPSEAVVVYDHRGKKLSRKRVQLLLSIKKHSKPLPL